MKEGLLLLGKNSEDLERKEWRIIKIDRQKMLIIKEESVLVLEDIDKDKRNLIKLILDKKEKKYF